MTLGISALGALMAALSAAAYRKHNQQLLDRAARLLQELVPLEAERLHDWWLERAADLSYHAAARAAAPVMRAALSGHPDAARLKALDGYFKAVLENRPDVRAVALLDRAGRPLWSLPPAAGQAPPDPALLAEALRTGKAALGEVRLAGRSALVDAAQPLAGGFLVERIDFARLAMPSIGNPPHSQDGGFDYDLARAGPEGATVLDHDPAVPGASRLYHLGPRSAVALALGAPAGTPVLGEDHFGQTVFALAGAFPGRGWRLVATREVGRSQRASARLAAIFALLGAAAIGTAGFILLLLQRASEEEMLRSAARLGTLNRLYRTLRGGIEEFSKAVSKHDLAERACRLLVDEGGFELAVVWIPDGEDPSRLRIEAVRGAAAIPPESRLSVDQSRPEGRSAAGLAFSTGTPVSVDDMDADPRTANFRATRKEYGLKSVVAQPLFCLGEAVGVLNIVSTRRGVFDAQIRELVGALAADIGHACERLVHAERAESSALDLGRAEADLARAAKAVECAAEMIVVTDAAGTITYVNPAFERVMGYARDEVLGRNMRLFKSGRQDASFYKGMWETLLAGRVWQGRFINKRKDGTLAEDESSIAPVIDASGRITGYVAVKRDVTKERSLESQLQQAQKLEAVGRLAGGIAHDFNNILTAILGNAALAREALPQASPQQADLAEIELSARRAAELTRQLLIFSRKQLVTPKLVDPAAVVGGLQRMLSRILGGDAVLRTVFETRGRRILVDPSQLGQVLMNFVLNARDAMPRGGEVKVIVGDAEPAEAIPGVDGPIPPGRYVVTTVRDSGTGIPPDVLPRIFEPFFTTKEAGKGTGLGLATAYGIVKQAGASLKVDTEAGVGTLMSVYWPAAAEPEAETPREAAGAAGPAGREAILLVEDDAAVRSLAERILRQAGYRVTSCGDVPAARDAASAPGEGFSLLLTDIVLPGKATGRDLALELTRRLPALKVLYTSGYSGNVLSRHEVQDPEVRLLAKPFDAPRLLGLVREVLDAA